MQGRLAQDLRRMARAVASAHERFVAQGLLTDTVVRGVVADSWRRSADAQVDPARAGAPVVLSDDELTAARESLVWAACVPMINSLVTEAAREAGHVVALGDADGRLLWVQGDPGRLAAAERMGFAAGSLWSEAAAGTNAPGTALAIDQPVQIHAHEHFVGVVQAWSCTAVPLHDPATGQVIGVIDVTGDDTVASPMALGLLRATAVAVEQALLTVPRPRPAEAARLEVLGLDRAVLHSGGTRRRLSLRHSELVLLLAHHPQGLTGERLATLLSESDVSPVTLRAELARLRRILGPDTGPASRPYRLTAPVHTDAADLLSRLRAGDVAGAVRAYRGPVLPGSTAPGVAEIAPNSAPECAAPRSPVAMRTCCWPSPPPRTVATISRSWARRCGGCPPTPPSAWGSRRASTGPTHCSACRGPADHRRDPGIHRRCNVAATWRLLRSGHPGTPPGRHEEDLA